MANTNTTEWCLVHIIGVKMVHKKKLQNQTDNKGGLISESFTLQFKFPKFHKQLYVVYTVFSWLK